MSNHSSTLCFTRLSSILGALAVSVFAMADAAPAQMSAIVIQRGASGARVLQLQQFPVPEPGMDQVRIRVYAAGVGGGAVPGMPMDFKAPSRSVGASQLSAPLRMPETGIPGIDFAGTIDALGPGVTQYRVGEAVYGTAAPGHGAYAQYALADVDMIGRKPERWTFEEAAIAASSALAAMRTLRDGHVRAGETVVVDGAAGSVGSAIVELAKLSGANVIAVASSRHRAYLKSLGADQIIDYDQYNGPLPIRDADVVVNTVPGQSVPALAYLKSGGAMVSIAGARPTAQQCSSAGVSCPNEQGGHRVPADAVLLLQLNRLVSAGKFRVHVQKAFPWPQAAEAQAFHSAGHAEGKVVLVLVSGHSRH